MTDGQRSVAGIRWLVVAVALAMVAGCGGPELPDGGGEAPPGDDPGVGDGDTGGGGAGGGSSDGPIQLTMDGTTYGYSVGRCEIIDEVVHVVAMSEDANGQFEATLPPWDREIAYAQRDGSLSASWQESDGSGFNLEASRSEPGTSWDWTVSGSDVQVAAVMAQRSTTTGSSLGESSDVTVEIQCPGGAFGSGMFAQQFAEQEFFPIGPGPQRVPGSVTIDLDGTEYPITFLVHCQIFAESVSAEGTSNDASVYLYSEGAGVNLDLLIGDRRAEEEGTRWHLPPDVELMDDFLFSGDDTTRSWSGTVVSEDGEEAEADITVECTEGDGFQSAGTGTIQLDGVTHELDLVNSCSIDGTTIDFFGTSTETDVALVVTGGGSQVLVGDENGEQSATFDVEFDVSGQRATWSGTLARGQQATIEIDCG